MARKMDENDFRAHRVILEPDDFAFGSDEPDHPPTDLVEEEVWSSLTVSPEYVAVCTSNHFGQAIKLVQAIAEEWIEAIGEPEKLGVVGYGMFDTMFDHDGFLFNATHGFYKQAFWSITDLGVRN